MDERRTVINEAHGLNLGKTAPVTAGDEGDAQTVKARLDACFSEDGVEATIFIGGQRASSFHSTSFKHFERWLKSWVYWNGKILPWIILASLCIAQSNSSACQVDIFHWDRALRKPASGVERNFKAGPHPFRLVYELSPDRLDVIVAQLRFDSLRRPSNPESGNRIGLGELSSDGFVDELGEKFNLKQGCVVADFLSVHFGCQAPANIRPAMRVSDLPRVNDALLIQERSDGLPSDCIAPPGVSLALPVGCDIAGNPRSESWGSGWTAYPLLFNRSFIGQPLSFSGVGGVVDSEAGGFFHPQTGVQITSSEVPERGAFLLSQMGHAPTVVQSRSRVKGINEDYGGFFPVEKWTVAGYRFLPLHYEASLFPAENSRVGQESLISGCFLSFENSRGRMQNQLSVPDSRRTEPTAGGRSRARVLLALPTNLSGRAITAPDKGALEETQPAMCGSSAPPAQFISNDKFLATTSVGRGSKRSDATGVSFQ